MKKCPKFDRGGLASALISACGISPDQADRCVTEIWQSFAEALARGDQIQIRGVGNWSTRPGRRPGRRYVRFRVSHKILDEADKHRQPADPDQFRSHTMAQIVARAHQLTGTRPTRRLVDTILAIVEYDRQKVLAALNRMAQRHQFYEPAAIPLFLRAVMAELLGRRKSSSHGWPRRRRRYWNCRQSG